MAKGMYIGAGSVARKVKKAYLGAGGVARKVKKAYLGVGGVARCVFSGEGVELIGAIEPLQTARRCLAAAQNGRFAFFAGGEDGNVKSVGHVDAYDQTFTKQSITDLRYPRKNHAAAWAGNYAIFAGGTDGSTILNVCEGYNVLGARANVPALGYAVQKLAATSRWDKQQALFAGGKDTSDATRIDSGSCYDMSLTKREFKLGFYGYDMAAAANLAYVMFAGGQFLEYGYFQMSKKTAAFDSSLTKVSSPELSSGAFGFVSCSTAEYIIFMGGARATTGSASDIMEAFDQSLTRHIGSPLSLARSCMSAERVGDYIVAVGGIGIGTAKSSAVIDVYDKSLTRIRTLALPDSTSEMASTGLGGSFRYALFGGGAKQNAPSLTVKKEVYAFEAI